MRARSESGSAGSASNARFNAALSPIAPDVVRRDRLLVARAPAVHGAVDEQQVAGFRDRHGMRCVQMGRRVATLQAQHARELAQRLRP